MLEWQSRHLQWFDFFIQGKGPKPVPAMTSPFDYQDDLRAIQDKSIENRKGFGRPASGVRKPGDSGVDDDLDLSKRACGSADDCRHVVSFARLAASRNRGLGGCTGIPYPAGTFGRFLAVRTSLCSLVVCSLTYLLCLLSYHLLSLLFPLHSPLF